MAQTEPPRIGFASLPAEIKLRILEYHTLSVNERIWPCPLLSALYPRLTAIVAEALHAFTHCQTSPPSCFHPTIYDLITLHFATEASVFPFDYCKRYSWQPSGLYHTLTEQQWKALESAEWYPGQPGLESQMITRSAYIRRLSGPMSWLYLLRFQAWRVRCILDSIRNHGVFRFKQPGAQAFDGFLYLLRFLQPLALPGSDLGYSNGLSFFGRLKADYRSMMVETIRNVVHSYVRCTGCQRREKFDRQPPFARVEMHYRPMVESQGIPWRRFIESGAYAACLQHYIFNFRSPSRLYQLFAGVAEIYMHQLLASGFRLYGDINEWSEPEKPTVFLRVSEVRDKIVLTSRSSAGSPDGSADLVALVEENRYWWMTHAEEGQQPDAAGIATTVKKYGEIGRFEFGKYDRVHPLWTDGFDFLQDDELQNLFNGAY